MNEPSTDPNPNPPSDAREPDRLTLSYRRVDLSEQTGTETRELVFASLAILASIGLVALAIAVIAGVFSLMMRMSGGTDALLAAITPLAVAVVLAAAGTTAFRSALATIRAGGKVGTAPPQSSMAGCALGLVVALLLVGGCGFSILALIVGGVAFVNHPSGVLGVLTLVATVLVGPAVMFAAFVLGRQIHD